MHPDAGPARWGRARHRVVSSLLLLAATIAAVIMASSPALAHAALTETSPFDGQTLEAPPEQIVLTFNEPVSAPTGGLRVFDSTGARVDRSDQSQPSRDTLVLDLPALPDGAYVATYRVTSDDGHVVRGAFLFDVGEAVAVSDGTLEAIFNAGDSPVVAVLAIAVRVLTYLSVLLAAGAVLWLVRVAQGDADEVVRAGSLASGAGSAAVVLSVLAVPVQAMLVGGQGLGVLGNGSLLGEVAGSSVGIAAFVRLAGAVGLVAVVRRGGLAAIPAGVAALLMLGSFLVDGHTRTADPAWLMLTADAVHVAAGAAWLGGLVLLARSVAARRADGEIPTAAAEVLRRFSSLATLSVVAVALAGGAMSWALVRKPRAVTTTDYGWVLLVKVALVAVVVLLGAYNNRRLVPAVSSSSPAAGWATLGRTVRAEVALLLAVVLATGILVNLRPAAEEAGITGPFDTLVAMSDEIQLNLVVDPNRAGFNSIHFYLFDATGRPISDVDSVDVSLSQPERDLGPIVREPFVAGPGHWQLDGRDLTFPGEWIVRVVVGVDRFTEASADVAVIVNE